MKTTEATKSMHTPGPWEVAGKDSTSVQTAGHNLVARAIDAPPYGDFNRASDEARERTNIAQANARLIAAAPDLLAEAINAAFHLESHGKAKSTMTRTDALIVAQRERGGTVLFAAPKELAAR